MIQQFPRIFKNPGKVNPTSSMTNAHCGLDQLMTTEIIAELRASRERFEFHIRDLKDPHTTNKMIGKRLMYVFQTELLPGISGKLVDNKMHREAGAGRGVKQEWKFVGWGVIILMDLGMLFYIYLFALTQSEDNQSAWLKTFIIWLLTDMIFISTAMVIIQHILLPQLAIKDVKAIQASILSMLKELQRAVKSKSEDAPKTKSNDAINVAPWMLASYRLAQQFPDHQISKVILQFQTAFPPRQLNRAANIKSVYSRKFSFITSGVAIIITSLLNKFLSFHGVIQDIVQTEVINIFTIYLLTLFVQLYNIYPALVLVPIIFVASLVHFFIQANQKVLPTATGNLPSSKPTKVEPLLPTATTTDPGSCSQDKAVTAINTSRELVHDEVRREIKIDIKIDPVIAERLEAFTHDAIGLEGEDNKVNTRYSSAGIVIPETVIAMDTRENEDYSIDDILFGDISLPPISLDDVQSEHFQNFMNSKRVSSRRSNRRSGRKSIQKGGNRSSMSSNRMSHRRSGRKSALSTRDFMQGECHEDDEAYSLFDSSVSDDDGADDDDGDDGYEILDAGHY